MKYIFCFRKINFQALEEYVAKLLKKKIREYYIHAYLYMMEEKCSFIKMIKIMKIIFPGRIILSKVENFICDAQVQFHQFRECAGYHPRQRDRRANLNDPFNSLAFLRAREGQDHPLGDRCSLSSRN